MSSQLWTPSYLAFLQKQEYSLLLAVLDSSFHGNDNCYLVLSTDAMRFAIFYVIFASPSSTVMTTHESRSPFPGTSPP